VPAAVVTTQSPLSHLSHASRPLLVFLLSTPHASSSSRQPLRRCTASRADWLSARRHGFHGETSNPEMLVPSELREDMRPGRWVEGCWISFDASSICYVIGELGMTSSWWQRWVFCVKKSLLQRVFEIVQMNFIFVMHSQVKNAAMNLGYAKFFSNVAYVFLWCWLCWKNMLHVLIVSIAKDDIVSKTLRNQVEICCISSFISEMLHHFTQLYISRETMLQKNVAYVVIHFAHGRLGLHWSETTSFISCVRS
jgi:hypothetical protein